MLPEHYKLNTHGHFMGETGSGKSKGVEHCFRQHILVINGQGHFHFHSQPYREMKAYLAYVRPKQSIVDLNPSDANYIRTYNPFQLPPGRDPSTHVSMLVNDIVKAWGAENLDETARLESTLKLVLWYAALSGQPLHHAAMILEFDQRDLRDHALQIIPDRTVKELLNYLQHISKTPAGHLAWNRQVESAQSRLGRFIGSRAVRLFTGLPGLTESVAEWIDKKAIVLANFTPSDNLPLESGKVFAALLLSEFMRVAMKNAENPKKYFLYLDECQNYVTRDAALMLDQSRKSGLRLTFIHHHMKQFPENIRDHIEASLRTNAQIKYIFRGVPLEDAKPIVEEFHLDELNKRLPKETIYQYVTEHKREKHQTVTDSDGMIDSTGETETAGNIGDVASNAHGYMFGSAFSSGRAVTTATRYRPVLVRLRHSQQDWTREEHLSKLAARHRNLADRHCYRKLPGGGDAKQHVIPFVRTYLLPDSPYVLQFDKDLQSTATPSHEADRILKEQELAFLERSKAYGSRGASRPKKKSSTLHPQG